MTGDASPGESLAEQLLALPGLYVGLLEACVDHGAQPSEQAVAGGRSRAKKSDPLAAPIELNLTILDFLAEPNGDGRLGMTRSLMALATVTRAAFGGATPDGMDRHQTGLAYLQHLGLSHRLDLTPERWVEAAAVAESVKYLVAQADRIRAGEHWTAAAAQHVASMYDEATVGIDDKLYETYRDWRTESRSLLAKRAEQPWAEDASERYDEWLELVDLAEAGYAVDRAEYVGRHLDSIRRWYKAAAAGGEQWGDFLAEEVYRLHARAEQLLGQAEQRGKVVDEAPCPFCETYQLVIVVHPPSPACAARTKAQLSAGAEPKPCRCCGEFVQCTSCGRSWSLRVDPETGRSEASLTFAAFRSSGWIPRPRVERTEHQFRATA
ncbi:MAG TPA: hypothetical protein VFH54_06065 [Mycobacteriales bacterium]|nr:hypothetical protein [Mycobacteriales bacterium]